MTTASRPNTQTLTDSCCLHMCTFAIGKMSMFLNVCIHRHTHTNTELWCIQGLISIDKDECESMPPSLLGKQILYQNLCLWNTHTHTHTHTHSHTIGTDININISASNSNQNICKWNNETCRRNVNISARISEQHYKKKHLKKTVIWLTQRWMKQSVCDELVVFMEAHFFVVVYFRKIFNDTFLSRVLHSVIYAFMQFCGCWWLVLVQTAMCLT